MNHFVPPFICLFVKCRHWYWLLSEVLWDLQAKTPLKVTEIMAVAILETHRQLFSH